MSRVLSVRLLGRFSVEVDGRPIAEEAWTRRRASALVKLLALAPGNRLPREVALDALWPELNVRAAAANLRKAAHFARRIVGSADAVVLGGDVIRLFPDGSVETDVGRFEAAARDALEHGDAERCRAVTALYAGDLLPDDEFEPWSERPREELRALHRRLLVTGGLWGRLLELDPASELAHREIMRERLEAGDRSGAIRQFEQMRTILRDELGVSPEPESIRLYERVLTAQEHDAPTPAERARALLAWGTIHWERSDLAEAERTAQEARALAIDAGLGRELADASELLGIIAYAQGHWRQLFADEFLKTTERTPELTPFVFDAHLCMSEFALHEADGMTAVAEFADELLASAVDATSPQVRALALLLRGEVELLGGGDLAQARRDLLDAVRLHEETSSATGEVIARERLAQANTLAGEIEAARDLHLEALQNGLDGPVANHVVPLIYGGLVESAPPRKVLDVVREGEAALAEMRPCAPCSMSFHVGAAKVCAARDHERARVHFDTAEQVAGMWRGGAWHAAISEARATLLLAEDADRSHVRALLAAAAEAFHAARRLRDERRCRSALDRLV